MSQQLVRLLRGGIERDRVVHLVVGGVGHLLVRTVDARRRGVDQVLDARLPVVIRVAAGLEDVVEADEVRLDVGVGVGDAVAHPGLCSQVDHYGGPVVGENLVDGGLVGNVAANEREARVGQLAEAIRFERHVVVVVHVVDADNGGRLGVGQQSADEVGADEARCARNQDGFVFKGYLVHYSLLYLIHGVQSYEVFLRWQSLLMKKVTESCASLDLFS